MFCSILKYCKTFKKLAKRYEKSNTNNNKEKIDELRKVH